MSGTPLKISLNGPALERLIGGDTEVELELRQQIVENFARKYLKELVNHQALQPIGQEILKEIKKEIGEEIWDSKKGQWGVVARERIQALLQKAIEQQLSVVLDNTVQKAMDTLAARLDASFRDYETRMLAYAERKARQVLDGLPAQAKLLLDRSFEQMVHQETQRRLELALKLGDELGKKPGE